MALGGQYLLFCTSILITKSGESYGKDIERQLCVGDCKLSININIIQRNSNKKCNGSQTLDKIFCFHFMLIF